MTAIQMKQKLMEWCDRRCSCDGCPFDTEDAWCNKPVSTKFTAQKLRELCAIAGIWTDDGEECDD